jgi:hypothetical protein
VEYVHSGNSSTTGRETKSKRNKNETMKNEPSEINGRKPAFPFGTQYPGLTKREYTAMHICASILGSDFMETSRQGGLDMVRSAVVMADLLLVELEKSK